MFDGTHGVNVCIRKLKDIPMWQLSMLEYVGIISSCGYSSFFYGSKVCLSPYAVGQQYCISVFYKQLLYLCGLESEKDFNIFFRGQI